MLGICLYLNIYAYILIKVLQYRSSRIIVACVGEALPNKCNALRNFLYCTGGANAPYGYS